MKKTTKNTGIDYTSGKPGLLQCKLKLVTTGKFSGMYISGVLH